MPHPAEPSATAGVHAEPSPASDRPRSGFSLRRAPWSAALDRLIGDAPASVSVAVGGVLRFSHRGHVPRAPASNEKLLLSMALLARFGPHARIPTTLEVARPIRGRVARGDVWIVGHGDPETDDATIERLASALADRVRRITGSVVGDTSTFVRDRWAPGWHPIARSFVSIPTALTLDGNVDAGGFDLHPELRAATLLTADLRALGVRVAGSPRTGGVPTRTRTLARIRSAPLVAILRDQNAYSNNLDAEVLGKWLAAATLGRRPSIPDAGRAIRRWAARRGVRLRAFDASGLSYADRVTTDGMVRLLSLAERRPWGAALMSTLPSPGVGTLVGRLPGLDVRAKTGTLLEGESALSGSVRDRRGRPITFSILSAGMRKEAAVALEDAVVRFLAARA